jgi:exonuclease III
LVAARAPDVALQEPTIGCYSCTVKVITAAREPWWITTVYGPQDEAKKGLFLEELEVVRDQCPGPWAIIGDFNLILDEADKSNSRINRRTMRAFRQTVGTLQLLDIHLHGRRYTWSNDREQPTLVRLDRVLASLDWEELFPACHLQALTSDASDHCPLLLQTNLALTPKPRFHFEIYWPMSSDYQATL